MGGGGSKKNASMAGFSSSESTDRSSTPAPSQQDETSPGQHAGTSSDPVTRHDPNLQYCRVCGVSVPNTFTSAYQHWMGKRHRRKLRELQENEAESDDVAVATETLRSASDSSLVTGRLRGRKRLRNQETEKPSDTKRTHAPNTREKQSSKAKKKGGTKKAKGKRKRKSSGCSNSTESKRTRLQSDHEDPNSERTDFPKDVGPNSCRNSFPSLTDLSQLDGPSHVTAPPLPPDDVTHVIFVDLDNWSHFFQKLPHELPSGSFVYGFAGGCTTWREPKNCSALTALQQNGCFYMHPSCGRWKDAADFAICVHAGKLDERLPKEVPFTVLSGDKGFYELAHQLRISSRRAHIVNPHEHDMDMVLGLLNSIGET